MKHWVLLTILFVLVTWVATAQSWDVRADTWGAVDALGRELPGHDAVGPPRADRFVGMFYFAWLGEHTTTGPWDITKILAANPGNPAWGPLHHFHHWGEPERGYYVSDDTYVLRKHVQELSDAGIDVLIFDNTNGFTYRSVYTPLFDIMAGMRADGHRTPQVAFFCNGNAAQQVYSDVYLANEHPDLWFRWEGKPLLLVTSADYDALSAAIRSFFTLRKTWGLQVIDENNEWSFMQHYPQSVGHSSAAPQVNEFMSVSIAQQETYISYPTAHGRSYHDGVEPPPQQRDRSGRNFAEQWERALSFDPKFVFVTGWNEWVAQRFEDENGNSRFVDAYSEEFSRDIEPMRGGYTDNYYYQLTSFVRRHKGVRPLEQATAPGGIQIDGAFDDWGGVTPEYRDQRKDTFHRNHPKWGGAETYTNTTGRNDIIAAKTAVGPDYVYFYVRCEEAITPWTDNHWMMLYIDSDQDTSTGWNGYDLLVNRNVISETATYVETHLTGWQWSQAATVEYRVEGAELELAIPRDVFGDSLEYAFKWSDNVQEEGDIIGFSLTGDSAPNRRAQYLVSAVESVPPLVLHHTADSNEDGAIDLSELLTVIQLYKRDAYHCDSEGGFVAGTGDTACDPHDSDYAPQDWRVSLAELLRLVQFANAGGYRDCRDADPPREDHFCPGVLM